MTITEIFRLLKSCYIEATLSRFPKFSQKYAVFRVLLRLSLKEKKEKEGQKDDLATQKIFGFNVTASSYHELLYLFRECFLEFQYYFVSKRIAPKIIDCGANIGMGILFFKWLYPHSQILAFEPNPQAFRFLKRNILDNNLKNVSLVNAGLSDKEGSLDFYVSENSLLSSLDPDRGGSKAIKIDCRRLSDILKSDYDLVKIDVEGAEWNILRDLDEANAIHHGDQYIVEYHHNMGNKSSYLSKFLNTFESHGYGYNIRSTFGSIGSFQDISVSFYRQHVNPPSAKAGVSILMCTHNGSKNLHETLKHLAAQRNSHNLNLEIIVIDNASTDNSGEIAKQIWRDLQRDDIPLSVLYEPRPGKDRAMDLGMAAAQYDYIVVCDDDNWLAEDYIERAYAIMNDNPGIGMLGGKGIPVFEHAAPSWFSQYECYYAVGPQYHQQGELKQSAFHMHFIWGAGAVINRRAYFMLRRAGFRRQLTFEKDPVISRSEDIELSIAIQLTGYKLWYDETLVYKHFIAADKLTWSYLIKITKPGAFARPYLKPYHHVICMGALTEKTTFWKAYVLQYTRYIMQENKSLRDLKNMLRVICGWHREGNADDHKKLREWYEFCKILKVNKKYDALYREVADLRIRIMKEREHIKTFDIQTSSNGNEQQDKCNLQYLEQVTEKVTESQAFSER